MLYYFDKAFKRGCAISYRVYGKNAFFFVCIGVDIPRMSSAFLKMPTTILNVVTKLKVKIYAVCF